MEELTENAEEGDEEDKQSEQKLGRLNFKVSWNGGKIPKKIQENEYIAVCVSVFYDEPNKNEYKETNRRNDTETMLKTLKLDLTQQISVEETILKTFLIRNKCV